MIQLPNVTLVCVDTVNHEAAIAAMRKSMEHLSFHAAYYFTNEGRPDDHLGIVTISRIQIKDKAEYSRFIMKHLHRFIETSHALIVQYDGYVINPHLWDPSWLQYDYIGAPWWYDDGHNVGNGGFSLRSRNLMWLASREAFNITHPEDDSICRTYRPVLERLGCRFAPEEVARVFSYEPNPTRPHFENNTFGFHGLPKLILQ